MRASLATAFSATLFTSALATPVLVERQSFPTTTTYDDGNSAVQFDEGGWTHLTNQGSQWKNGTESYTDNPSGAYRVEWPYVYEGLGQTFGLRIWSGRKDDRGDFEVYTYNYTDPTVETSIGYGNAYAAFAEEPTSSEVVFEIHDLYVEGPAQLVVRNRPSGDQKFITLDYIEFSYNAP